MKGFRYGSSLYDTYLKKNVVSIVSREARGFLLAGFFGGLLGGFCASIFALGVGAFFF